MIEYSNFKNTTINCNKNYINIYITKVFGWMFCGLILTSYIAWNIVNTTYIMQYLFYNKILLFVLCLLQLGLVFTISNFLNRLSGQILTILFIFYSCLTGITTASICSLYNHNTIFTAFITAASTFLIMYIWGYTTKKDLSHINNIIMMGLIGIILSSFINLFFHNDIIISIINYISIILFTVLIAVDTQKLKTFANIISTNLNDTDNIRRYAILGALILYLDFINLFLTILRVLGNNDKNQENNE
ncbi:Bax inhibitor-1/YccA family protein [Enterobacteriaceae endosymbiont of Neohaemonia nigricornis]|uniref:Bax inhibitor-1/YccA family protein n=1 Tax=Enterobacteriaceae endosymbiont of Neohaemonia nigricornis TaxID=2675792 RepID=UPI00144A2B66|nr:Bax inhibitor-1/YccA family protein [Enterobacteriaceae endosymbiont of Neohaemonia nigricornis]QJC30337.1 BAX inhibitor (BI)-1/YccA family protein [Enterobacteriaceae endosymbiont of Neohaemonia nigricornis]